MKRVVFGMAVALLVAWPTLAMAQDQGGDQGGRQGRQARQGRQGGQRGAQGRRGGRGGFDMFAQLNLTEEQRTKIREAFQSGQTDEQRQADRDKMRKLFEDLRAAREADDQEKVKALTEQLGQMRTAREDRMKQVLDPILTDEQKTKLAELIAQRNQPRSPLGSLIGNAEQLGLTAEQLEKIKAIDAEALAQMQKLGANDFTGRRTLGDKARTDGEALLTDEQKQKYQQLRARRFGGAPAGNLSERLKSGVLADVGLTDQQRAQVDELAKVAGDAMGKLDPGNRDGRQQLQAKLMADIRAILTPEQQEKFDKAVQADRQRTQNRRGPGQGGQRPAGQQPAPQTPPAVPPLD